MEIRDLSENILLVEAPPEPGLNEELAKTIDTVRERNDGCDLIIDFSHVDIVTSSSLSKLLKLRKLLMDCNHSLVLCSVARATKGIFSVTALDSVFTIVSDKAVAVDEINKQQPTMT
ncbi:MAG: STAS domain-containing protein [Sedimentisphaerales bacterium]|jgi:anti-anti-sigma factor